MNELALFPLNSFILPEGRMRLRVFERRYVRLICEASSGKRNFAIAQINPYVAQQHPERILSLATAVRIDDFEQLDDGLLGVTVIGVEKVLITNRWQESDGLNVADTQALTTWPKHDIANEYHPLVKQLEKLLQQYPELMALYPEPKYHDAAWLASRYLELLPMKPALKQQLALEQTPTPCLNSLQAWLANYA